MISRAELLTAVTKYYEAEDLSFIETLNNITFGYKVALKRNLTKQNNEYKLLK